MDIDECIRLANEYPVAWMATTEDDQPRVRPLQMWFADTTGFYFHTWRVKNLYREIMKNPLVELGFWIPEENGGTVLRVAGQVEWVDDPALKCRSFEERPFLARLGLTPESPDLVLFRIARGEVYTCPNEKVRFGA
jgi:pyridoxamine 5'-phosphate oxidase